MPHYKTIRTRTNIQQQKIDYYYWLEEVSEETPDNSADHHLVIKQHQIMRNYASGLMGICPECLAQGVYSPMQRNNIFGVDPLIPIAVIDTCIKCGIRSNQLFFYYENQAKN